jgi:hypothetical protein
LFGLSAIANWNDAKKLCSTTSCPSDTRGAAESDRTTALTQSTVSTVGLIAGGALVVGGLVMIIAAPREEPAKTGTRVVPVVGPGQAGLQVQGVF